MYPGRAIVMIVIQKCQDVIAWIYSLRMLSFGLAKREPPLSSFVFSSFSFERTREFALTVKFVLRDVSAAT